MFSSLNISIHNMLYLVIAVDGIFFLFGFWIYDLELHICIYYTIVWTHEIKIKKKKILIGIRM